MSIASLPSFRAPVTANGARAPESTAAPSTTALSTAAPATGTSQQPAVTVNLSDAALAALASRSATASVGQASATSAASAATQGVPNLVVQAQQLAGVIADGSTASNADKATALAGLYQLRFKSGGYAAGPAEATWFGQSTQAQRDQINNAVDKSAFFKQAVSAASQFHADGMAIARAGQSADSRQTAYARFSQLPADQQVLVWAGGASQFGTVEQYSAFLGQQAARAAGTASAAASAAATAQTASTSIPTPAPSRVSAYGAPPSDSQGSTISLTA